MTLSMNGSGKNVMDFVSYMPALSVNWSGKKVMAFRGDYQL